MEYNELLKHIAALEARCLHLETYILNLVRLNPEKLIPPTKDFIIADLKEKQETAREKYGIE